VKLKRIEPVRVRTTLLVIEREGKILLWRRDPAAQRLGGFWELPSTEELPKVRAKQAVGSFRHSITNHNYTFTVMRAKLSGPLQGFEWIEPSRLEQLPLSTTTKKALALAL